MPSESIIRGTGSLRCPLLCWSPTRGREDVLPRPIEPKIVDEVRRALGDRVLLALHWVGDESSVFQVIVDDRVTAYLKLSAELAAERERLEWLEGRLPVPRVVGAGVVASGQWMLTRALPGLSLANLKHMTSADRIVAELAEALHVLHETPAGDCPFGDGTPGSVLTHGDACLPNFLFSGGTLTGIVDVGRCGLGDLRSDLATAVWSVQYNLGPGHAMDFLRSYGIDLHADGLELAVDADGIESLRLVDEPTGS